MSGQRNQECLFESIFTDETPITTTKVDAKVFDSFQNPKSESTTTATDANLDPESPCISLVDTKITKKCSIKNKTTVSKKKTITKNVRKAVTLAHDFRENQRHFKCKTCSAIFERSHQLGGHTSRQHPG